MNYAIVFRLLSYILMCEGALMLLPALASALYAEWTVVWVFLFTAALCAVLGGLLHLVRPSSQIFYMREGFVTTALSWIIISVMGALPFVLSGAIPDPVDALFETVSGFTTTGASILPAVEGLPQGILFWRSFTHWVGGMGVLVFLLTLLPLTGGSHVNLMKAESPGPQVDKLVPKVQSTAKILYGIYMALTVLEMVFLMLGGMPVFDSLLTAFGTAGTGGFGIRNDSFGSYSPYLQGVVTVFMILFGVNFNFYFLMLMRKFRRAAASEEVRWYFIIITAAVVLISWNISGMYDTLGEAVRHAAFQVGSIITTTGFSSCDFNLWPVLSKQILVILMFIGACAGSTGGGIKVSRILILRKTLGKELKQALHPQVVAPVRMDGKLLNHETIRSTNVFMAAYILIFVFSLLFITLDGLDLVTNFTAVAATLNNIGPGLELVGPMSNFSVFSVPAKLVLIFDMLAGRLEIFPMLVLFSRDTWQKF
ncbi:MAG: TrkH family potassium uptake protein [Faecalibacterium sp.]